MAPGAQYRPVVIECHPGKSLARQKFLDRTARFIPHLGDALCVRTGERTADRGYVRQPLRTGNAFDHPVIPVGVHVAQLPTSDDRVHDQQHHDHVMTVNGIGPRMAEASSQPFPDAEEGEEVPEDDGSRIRCEVPRFESDAKARLGFTSNVSSTMPHPRGLRFSWYFFAIHNHCTGFGDHVPFHYFRLMIDPVRFRTRFRNHACDLSSPAADISHTAASARPPPPVFRRANARMGRFLCNWRVYKRREQCWRRAGGIGWPEAHPAAAR